MIHARRAVLVSILIGTALGAQEPEDKSYSAVSVRLPRNETSATARIIPILERHFQAHGSVRARADAEGFEIAFEVDPKLALDAFKIEDSGRGVLISGQSDRSLLYGLGKFLRSSRYGPKGISPSRWRGVSAPAKPVRGVYFASHFHNFYHEAPLPEVETYLEDLALWGINNVAVWYDMHEYKGIDDPGARRTIDLLKGILGAAKRVGMDTTLLALANEAYAESPSALRADWTPGHDGYTAEIMGHYHLELCPSKAGAKEKLLKWRGEVFKAFSEVNLDSLILWPYDQGGCTCADCKPWGTNGFLRIARPISEMFRAARPKGRVILSTWLFDQFTKGEWSGLKEAFQRKPDWVDGLMVGDYVEAKLLEDGLPGGLPAVDFPEISMWGVGGWGPWGGFGASPYPARVQEMWNARSRFLQGGFPYSEGIFEDMNKVVFSQLAWHEGRRWEESIREYAEYEFTPEVADAVVQAVAMMEKTLPRTKEVKGDRTRYILGTREGVDETWKQVEKAESRLSPEARKSWRWRVFYLRALIDRELAQHDGDLTDRAEEAFQELTKIYHAGEAAFPVAPPTREALKAHRKY